MFWNELKTYFENKHLKRNVIVLFFLHKHVGNVHFIQLFIFGGTMNPYLTIPQGDELKIYRNDVDEAWTGLTIIGKYRLNL